MSQDHWIPARRDETCIQGGEHIPGQGDRAQGASGMGSSVPGLDGWLSEPWRDTVMQPSPNSLSFSINRVIVLLYNPLQFSKLLKPTRMARDTETALCAPLLTAVSGHGQFLINLGSQGNSSTMETGNRSPGKVWYNKSDIWSLSPVPGTKLLSPGKVLSDKGDRNPFCSEEVVGP